MSIRIRTIAEAGRTVVKVDGRLKEADLEELSKVVPSVQMGTVLELSELRSADRAALERLRELISLGVEVRGASPYIELLLETKPARRDVQDSE